MNPDNIKLVASECQQIARIMARYQNLTGVGFPYYIPRTWLFRTLFSIFFTQAREHQFVITPEFVTRMTSAFLSAGNMLETQAKRMEAVTPEPTPTETTNAS